MYRRGFFVRILLAILLVVVIVGGGIAAYRVGWGQGYMAGSAISSIEGVESRGLVPQFGNQLYRPFYPGFGFPFFGLCFGIGFIFLIMFLVGGLLRPWRRRRWMGYPHHANWENGPMPHWAKEWVEYQQKKAEEKDADKGSDVAQSAAE